MLTKLPSAFKLLSPAVNVLPTEAILAVALRFTKPFSSPTPTVNLEPAPDNILHWLVYQLL